MLPHIISLLILFLVPTQCNVYTPFQLQFTYKPIETAEQAMAYLTKGPHNVAWVNIAYCNGRFHVHTCTDPQLSFDTLFQLSYEAKSFFMKFEMDSVRNSGLMEPLLRTVPKYYLFFGIPVAAGPMSKPFPKDYDPMRPQFVASRVRICLMFEEKPKGNVGYTQAQMDEMLIYVQQYQNAGATVGVAYDAYYLSITKEKILRSHLEHESRAIIYYLDDQPEVELSRLKEVYTLLNSGEANVTILSGYSKARRIYSYMPTVSWFHMPYMIQRSFPSQKEFFHFIGNQRQLIELRVLTKCKNYSDSVLTKCPRYETPNVPLDNVLQQKELRKIVLLDFDNLDYAKRYQFTEYFQLTYVLLEAANGPNYENIRADSRMPDQEQEIESVRLTPGVMFVMGFREAQGNETQYTKQQVDDLMAKIPKDLVKQGVGLRLQYRALARMNVLELRAAFHAVLKNPVVKCLFLTKADIGIDQAPRLEWPVLKLFQIANLRENIKEFNVQTYLFEDNPEYYMLLYEESSVAVPTLTPKPPTTIASVPNRPMTWYQTPPAHKSGGRMDKVAVFNVIVLVIGGWLMRNKLGN